MKSKLIFTLILFLFIVASAAVAQESSNFQVVGQNPLLNRGMNAAATIFENFIYIGNRTDGSSRCGFGDPRRTDPSFGLNACAHPHPGILILNIQDPSNPTVVGEIPAPLNAAGVLHSETSRELRVWPSAKLLITMNFRCSSVIHACVGSNNTLAPFDIKFFSLNNPTNPQFISHYVPTSKAGLAVEPHEMFLWVDPNEDNRALLLLRLLRSIRIRQFRNCWSWTSAKFRAVAPSPKWPKGIGITAIPAPARPTIPLIRILRMAAVRTTAISSFTRSG